MLAGCGGGGPGADTNGSETASPDVSSQQREVDLKVAYQTALDLCAAVPLKDLADTHGVERTPEAVAAAIAKQEADPGLGEEARKGCLKGLGK